MADAPPAARCDGPGQGGRRVRAQSAPKHGSPPNRSSLTTNMHVVCPKQRSCRAGVPGEGEGVQWAWAPWQSGQGAAPTHLQHGLRLHGVTRSRRSEVGHAVGVAVARGTAVARKGDLERQRRAAREQRPCRRGPAVESATVATAGRASTRTLEMNSPPQSKMTSSCSFASAQVYLFPYPVPVNWGLIYVACARLLTVAMASSSIREPIVASASCHQPRGAALSTTRVAQGYPLSQSSEAQRCWGLQHYDESSTM